MDYEYQNAAPLTEQEDAGMKAALLVSSGVLMGLGLRSKFLRRVAGLACAALTAGIAIPLAQEYIEKKRTEGDGTLVDIRVETGDDPDKEPIFQFKVEADPIPKEEPAAGEPAAGEPAGDAAPVEPPQPFGE